MIQPQYLPDSRSMTFITELSGFRHLHLLDPTYEQLVQLTHGRFEVYPFGISNDHARIFATATKDDPAQENIFSIDVQSGQMTKLSKLEGLCLDWPMVNFDSLQWFATIIAGAGNIFVTELL